MGMNNCCSYCCLFPDFDDAVAGGGDEQLVEHVEGGDDIPVTLGRTGQAPVRLFLRDATHFPVFLQQNDAFQFALPIADVVAQTWMFKLYWERPNPFEINPTKNGV